MFQDKAFQGSHLVSGWSLDVGDDCSCQARDGLDEGEYWSGLAVGGRAEVGVVDLDEWFVDERSSFVVGGS